MLAESLSSGSMASKLAQVLPEGGSAPSTALAAVVCLGQAILLEGPMKAPPQRCWDLLERMLACFPVCPPPTAKKVEVEKEKEDRYLDSAPGLQNWWLSGERLELSPVERLGLFDQSMALVRCLAMAEAQSAVPHYRGHLLLPLLPHFHEGMQKLTWPALGGKKAGDVVLISDAPAAPAAAGAGAGAARPTLLRTTSAVQESWAEAAQSLRQIAGRLTVHGEELKRNCQQNVEWIKAMLPLSDEVSAGLLKDAELSLMFFEPKIEEWRAGAQEAMIWLQKEDDRQKECLAQSRSLRGTPEEVPDSPNTAAVQTRLESEHTVHSMARAGEAVILSVTGGLLYLAQAASGKSAPTWLQQGESGFLDGNIDTAKLGERAVSLGSCQDGSILVADTSNHRIRRINAALTQIETLAGSGVKGQRDGAVLLATFSAPVAVLETPSGILVLEEAHPGTVRVIEGGLVDSIALPMGRHNMKEAAALTLDSAEGHAYLAHSGAVVRVSKIECSWKAESVLDLKGITGLTHMRNPEHPESYGFLLSRKDYRLGLWDSKGKSSVVAGQAMSRGQVDGLGAEARFSALGQQLVLSDGSLLVVDGKLVRRLVMKALRQSEVARAAQTLEHSASLAQQRASRLRAAWTEVLELLGGPLNTVAATRRALCEERFDQELSRAGKEALAFSAELLSMAPSLSCAEKLMRMTGERLTQDLQIKLTSYFWPPCVQSEGRPFQHKDLEALQRMAAGGFLSMEAAVNCVDGVWFARQVGFMPALVGLFETLRSCFPERPMHLCMVRWALRRYVRSSFTRIAKELQDRGADDPMLAAAFAQWLMDTLRPLDQELRDGGSGGLPWLLEDLLLEHLIGDGIEPRGWFLQQHRLADHFGPELRKSLVVALRRVASELPLRRVIEALGLTDEEQNVSRAQAELVAVALEISLEPKKKPERPEHILPGTAGGFKERKDLKEAKDPKEMELLDVLKLDLLSWSRVLRWFDQAQEQLPEDLQKRLAKCIDPVGKIGMELLATACENGTLSITAVTQLAGADRRADGCEALEIAGYVAASDALRGWQSRLVEGTGTLQSLVETCKSLWPEDPKLLMAISRAKEVWPELPVKGALSTLNGEETGYFPQVPVELLRCSSALALLGQSGAFKALWKQHEVGTFKEEHLRSSAQQWAEIYRSLEKPEGSSLKLSQLDQVLERLQHQAELRLMAVTGCPSTLETLTWQALEDPGTWEVQAQQLAQKLWHSWSVKMALKGLKKTLASLQEMLLDETGKQDAAEVLTVLLQLEEHFARWESTPLKDSVEMTKLSQKIDPRLLMHSQELMTSIFQSFDLLQWLRKMPEDADYLVRVEIALGRSEMEVPTELWLSNEGRVDESKLSALTAVRTTLHELIYRPAKRFASLDALLLSLSSLENSSEIAGLVHALNFANSMYAPLSELLGGKDAALARMLQMLKPTSHARWVMSYPREIAQHVPDQEGEMEEEALAEIPAEARLLYLLLNDPGTSQKSQPQRLVEILDFQAAVTLAASTSDAAFQQVGTFNEQIGLVRLAVTVVEDLRVTGHPEFQEFHLEWLLSMALQQMKHKLNELRDRQANWHRKLTELRRSHPVLGFFAARQLGALLRQLRQGGDAQVAEVLAAVALTWSWRGADGSAWAKRLAQTGGWTVEVQEGPALLAQDAESLQKLADALQATWPGATAAATATAAPTALAEPFECGPGAQVVLAQDVKMATAMVLWPFLSLKRRPRPHEVLLCHPKSSTEQMLLLLLRWCQSSEGFFCLLLPESSSFAAQQTIVQAVHDATDEGGPLPKPRCPLMLVICGAQAAQAQVATQLMAHRVELRPPLELFAQEVAPWLLASGDREELGISVHVGPHCGCGKTFSVRMTAKEADCDYATLKLTASMGIGKLSQELRTALAQRTVAPGEGTPWAPPGTRRKQLLHLDLSAGQQLLDSEAFAVALLELLVLGRLGRTAARTPQAIFELESRVRVALELPAGASADGWPRAPLLGWLPVVSCSSEAASFRADEASLRFGMGAAFASARHDGVKDGSPANAYRRLQFVCGALAVSKRLKGAFPLHFRANDLTELSGETCYQLLVETAKLQLRPSLWNLWAFVDVLYWQLKEVHHPESVANQACLPEEGAPMEKPLDEIQPEDCPIFKGELIAFILRTARDFATRQTKNNEVDPETVVAADLVNFHQDRFCGRWRLQPFSSDGHPVFSRFDKSEKGSGQFFLYYRAAQKMWTIDAEVDKVAPAFAYTRNSNYKKGWWRMASWVVNKGMRVLTAENVLGFGCQAVVVSGVDEQLTGSPEEYLVPLNGTYLRQPKEDDVNGRAHYVLEKPRRHLFFDVGMDCWCIAHICHSDEGVYAKSCSKTLVSQYLTMGVDQKVPEAMVTFVTAGQEATATTRQQEEAEGETDFPLLRWEDSSHDCMLFSNRQHQVCFLSSQPSRLRISMHPGLLQLLERNRVSVGESLDALSADHTKVLGCLTGVNRTLADAATLLDGKYCLTGDAVLKMLAIFVRMRCGLPVILMGECGCGKTELVRYLCAWMRLPLLTLNVHGGTTEDDMDQVFREARTMAEEESAKDGLVVFLDEINTSQHVNMLCEAVLERSYRSCALPETVTVLAALNPRRKRPQAQMTTGLVYGAGGAEEEMSSLVYRVHSVPETVNDFLFDFGALTKRAEEMYIRSMVQNCWPESPDREQVLVTSLLGLAQDFIRFHEGDPSAVSLRDVKRCLRVAKWMQERFAKKSSTGSPHAPSVVVAVALVYHYRLPTRERRHQLWVDLTRRSLWPPESGVMKNRGWEPLKKTKEENGLTVTWRQRLRPVKTTGKPQLERRERRSKQNDTAEAKNKGIHTVQVIQSMENLLLRVQANVAKEFEVEKDVVMNEALSENVFVGLLCIMNRIPLFIVGKPGTSKTLCMQVLLSNLQGKQSKSKVLQSLPALRIMQYQCSPLSTAYGIQRQFDAAGRFASNALDAQVVLLLDEVGLAEFSPDMPLKVLHGILAEPGTVAVVGLSNWRLDPAKMNRSVCLARPDPDSAEVGRTGAGLLSELSDDKTKKDAPAWLASLSEAFWSVFADQGARDWLGMRDYYGFVRAVRDGCLRAKTEQPTHEILSFAIQRNFGGQPVLLERMMQAMLPAGAGEMAYPLTELLSTSLADRKARHLLLASQGPALPWLQAASVLPKDAEILLGSDFPEDALEAYAIRQLMRVRDAMAKGRSLVLYGMDVIYEALYDDVLNQRYVRRRTEDGEIELMLRLAIGARSQLCPMAESFKLLVLVDQEQAFKQLDVPFLNRFEKQLVQPVDLLPPDRRSALAELDLWCRAVALEAACEVVPGGLAKQGALAALMLARPTASLEELQRCIFDMALPLAVFRSSSLQQMQRKEEEYFEVRRSMADALRYAQTLGTLCEVATSSPMAHMPPVRELADVGGTEIIPVAQLSGSQQLEDILEKFFLEAEADATKTRSLVLQLDALSSVSRLSLTRHCCTVARARHQAAPNAHVFLVQHRAGWSPEHGATGYTWQPELGWNSIFVDDLQGEGRETGEGSALVGQSLKDFLQLSVHDLQQKNRIPSLAQILLRRGSSCVARCVQPGVNLEFLAERLRAVKKALEELPAFRQAVEALAMLVLSQWTSSSGLHLHVKLAMQEMRFGSLRKSVWLSIERLQLSALTHALRWMDRDFNLRHVTQATPKALRLWLALVASSSQSAAQVMSAALRPGAALQGPAPVPNSGRFGPLECRCPFSARILTQCAAVASNVEERDPIRLQTLCTQIFGEEAMKAFKDFEDTDPGALLHDAVSIWAPIYPFLNFELMLKVYTLAFQNKAGSSPSQSPLELVVIFQSCKQLVQSVCSVLSLVESSFGEGEENEASLRILDSVHGSLPGSLVQAVGTLPATAEWVDRAQPHVQMLLFLGSTDDVLSMASAWYRLRLKLQFQSVLGEERVKDIPPISSAQELLTQDFWRSTVSSLRDMTRMSQEPAKSKEDQTAEAEVARAFCSGLALLEDLLRLPTALAALEASGLAEVVWSSVMQEDPTNFHLQRLPTECAKSLLRWLHLDPVSKVLKSTTLKSKTLRLYMNFLEDVLELDTCRDKDIAEVQTTRTCSPNLLRAAVRLRRSLCHYANSLVGSGVPPPAPAELQELLKRNKSAALFVAKAIRRRGGDLELCRLAIVHEGALPWFPLNPARLPNLSNDLPDPFVNLLPKLDETLKRYNALCSAAGLCASSPNDQAFKEAVARALPGVASGRRTAMVLGAITSRVLLNRQVAIEEGLRKLKEWTTESLNEETNVSRRSKQALVDRMFAGTLLPHVKDGLGRGRS
ncbi:unnamed protein product [Durusdinium trenchii]|uniref:AAA+ ATPase domain-containing protein n=1 Tax=Durusdinium trenchii TaxID=1381693 RepID=A0ABP0K5Z6_9DINO